jgi:hypothetical protein
MWSARLRISEAVMQVVGFFASQVFDGSVVELLVHHPLSEAVGAVQI